MRGPVAGIFLLLTCLFILSIACGCLRNSASAENLSPNELAGRYLQHADAIQDYRSVYVVFHGTGDRSPDRIRFIWKNPAMARMEVLQSAEKEPGTLAITNRTAMTWYDAGTRTFDQSYNLEVTKEYDYQGTIRQIVADRNFTILDKVARNGDELYLIEAETPPGSDRYIPYSRSRVRAWVDPFKGVSWNISMYYDCGPGSRPTLAPGPIAGDVCEQTGMPSEEIRYESLIANTGIPDSEFDFIPPAGSGPRCVPKFTGYVEPPRTDTSTPIEKPLPGPPRYLLNETDTGKMIVLEPGETIEITLGTIPGLAFRWMMPMEGSGLTLMNAGPIYVPPDSPGDYFLGGKGYYRWRFKAISPGNETLDGVFALDGCDLEGARRFNLTVQVRA